ncbi:MAG: formate dehydrogenase subunit gamma [Pseudomonadota bacterium]
MFKSVMAFVLSAMLIVPAFAQSSLTGEGAKFDNTEVPAAILERQRALDDGGSVAPAPIDNSAATIARQLSAGAQDEDVYRAIRYGTGDVYVSDKDPEARVLVQTGGMRWLEVREGPLLTYGGGLLLVILGLLLVFFMVRGRVRVEGGPAGVTVTRFTFIERFAHWLLAGSFLVLAVSGLFLLFGREFLIPTLGHELYATLAGACKWAHNNVSWAFMIALVMIFVLWVWNNIPSKRDIEWIKKGGGLFKKGVHVNAAKFNAGQKLIFWMTIVLGASVSASGLMLLFPFELPMFAGTFELINATGIPGLFGAELKTVLAPHEEMQYAQLWHSIVSFVMMAVIIAHIYIGSVGMEGAFAAMGSGQVDENWAREHHSVWAEKKIAKKRGAAAQPAE